jgi:magnesium chelatase family protein
VACHYKRFLKKALRWPELNAREAAMVGGVEVYPVRSLLDVIRFVNTGNGVQPLKVDGDGLLNEIAALHCRL